MTTLDHHKDIEFGGSAIYRIVFQGGSELRLERPAGPAWRSPRSAQPVSPLKQLWPEKVRDQAELSGVLETLYSLHLPILKVEQVEDEA